MPTYDQEPFFLRDWEALTVSQQDRFIKAMKKMVKDIRSGEGFRKGLRVKGVQGHPGIYEMAWADDGRATFSYGTSPNPGDTHIVWRRIGGHDILGNP